MTKRYFIIQETSTGTRCLPYTEQGFETYSKARHYLNKTGESWCSIKGIVQ